MAQKILSSAIIHSNSIGKVMEMLLTKIMAFLELILILNNCMFNSKFYLQIKICVIWEQYVH